MKKIFSQKLLFAVLVTMTFLPLVSILARDTRLGYYAIDPYRSYNQNYGYYYDERYGGYRYDPYYGGYYGGYGGVVYPGPWSQPGMSDDSNALYQSYLRQSGVSY